MKITAYPTPNFSPKSHSFDMIILHYTDLCSTEEALEILSDPLKKVSCHYLVAENGQIYKMVPEHLVAHHAGISAWQDRTSINPYSIGIELDNLGHQAGLPAFSDSQITALVELIRDIRTRHTIPDRYILGHSDVAPLRKKDPGENFPWEILAKEGIGLWPSPTTARGAVAELSTHQVQELLKHIGYALPITGEMDAATVAALTAFQRHYVPRHVTGQCNKETAQALLGLRALVS